MLKMTGKFPEQHPDHRRENQKKKEKIVFVQVPIEERAIEIAEKN